MSKIDPQYLALAVNALMTVSMLAQGRWPQALYWFSTVLIVVSLLWGMRS